MLGARGHEVHVDDCGAFADAALDYVSDGDSEEIGGDADYGLDSLLG